MKVDENGLPYLEQNFEEAIKAVNYALSSDSIPSEISKLLNDDNCVNLTTKVYIFRYILNSLVFYIIYNSHLCNYYCKFFRANLSGLCLMH